MKYKCIFLDFEVFYLNWLVCITEYWLEDGEIKTKELEIVDDRKELIKYYYNNYRTSIFVGHNIGRYDYPIFIAIMEGLNPFEISNKLINGKEHWKMSNVVPEYKNYKFNYIDTCQDASKLALKAFEGYIDLPIITTEVDFNLNRKLTDDEIQLTIKYCRADVNALITLFNTTLGATMTKLRLIKTYNLSLDALSKSNAQLVAMLLGKGFVEKFDDANNPFNFDLIPVKPATKQIVDFYSQPIIDGNSYNIMIGGIWLNYAFGGLHGAIPNFKYEGCLWMYDISSLYPSIMIYYDFFSRNMSKEKKREYIELYFGRLANKCSNNEALRKVIDREIKFFNEHPQYGKFVDTTDWSVEHKPDKKQANDSKLVLNTAYGTFGDQFSKLYDKRMANNICIAGQMIMTVLIERLSPYVKQVNVNTDGIYFIPNKGCEQTILDIISNWEKETQMSGELEKAVKIYQKDVNNYILLEEDGSIKTKGGMTRQYIGLDKQPIRQSLAVIDDCICEYFMKGTPVRWTLLKTLKENPTRFKQMLIGSSKYDKYNWFHNGKYEELGQITRVYATKDILCGGVNKIKTNAIRKTGETYIQYNKFPDTSEHCYVDNDLSFNFDDIDLDYYEQLANDRIEKYEKER